MLSRSEKRSKRWRFTPAGGDRTQLIIDIFPLIPIDSLEQILDQNWFPEHLSKQ